MARREAAVHNVQVQPNERSVLRRSMGGAVLDVVVVVVVGIWGL